MGTNDASRAARFMEQFDEQIRFIKVKRRVDTNFEPENIGELEKRYKDEKDRFRSYETLTAQNRVISEQLEAIVASPDSHQHQLAIQTTRIWGRFMIWIGEVRQPKGRWKAPEEKNGARR